MVSRILQLMPQSLPRFGYHEAIKELPPQEHSDKVSYSEQISRRQKHNTRWLQEGFDTFHHDVTRNRNVLNDLQQDNDIEFTTIGLPSGSITWSWASFHQ